MPRHVQSCQVLIRKSINDHSIIPLIWRISNPQWYLRSGLAARDHHDHDSGDDNNYAYNDDVNYDKMMMMMMTRIMIITMVIIMITRP